MSLDCSPCGPFLQWLAIVGPEVFEAEYVLQSLVHVERLCAVGTAFLTGCVAQPFDDLCDLGVAVQHPGWRNRRVIACANQGKGVGQLLGHTRDNICKIGLGTDSVRKGCSYLIREIWSLAGKSRGKGEVGKKACKGWRGLEKSAVDGLHLRGQGMKGIDLVVEETCRFLAVADGIVELVDLELVVFEQGMVGAFGKEQGRDRQGVNGWSCNTYACLFQKG